jgi:hypothetical protein
VRRPLALLEQKETPALLEHREHRALRVPLGILVPTELMELMEQTASTEQTESMGFAPL